MVDFHGFSTSRLVCKRVILQSTSRFLPLHPSVGPYFLRMALLRLSQRRTRPLAVTQISCDLRRQGWCIQLDSHGLLGVPPKWYLTPPDVTGNRSWNGNAAGTNPPIDQNMFISNKTLLHTLSLILNNHILTIINH